MSVRCEECKYENLPQHSFCGMCGAKLPSRQRVEREREEAQAFSRPSLLGLAEKDPTEAERAEYLLQDEPGGTHWGRLAVLLVLLVAIAGSGWHWREPVRAWISRAAKTPAATQAPDTSATTPVTARADTTPASNPPAVQQAPANDDGKPGMTAPAPTMGASDQTTTPQPSPAATDAAKREPEPQEAQAPVKKKPELKHAASRMEFKTPAKNVSAEVLEVQGEDYLYGHGVQPDCGRAGKSLLAAAAQSSVKAQSVLGTMYATGHCVTRDVPVAYRWFAKASRQDPGNIRIQRDLEVLWTQMTPAERDLAAKTGP